MWKISKFEILFFLNASINKMVPKGSGNEKNMQSMLPWLKTAKNCWKMSFFMARLSPFYGFWCNLAYWIWNGYRAEILTFGLQNMKKNMVNFLGLNSAQTKMSKSYPSFFMFSLKNLKKKIFEKKNDRKSWIFDYGALIQIVSAGILS